MRLPTTISARIIGDVLYETQGSTEKLWNIQLLKKAKRLTTIYCIGFDWVEMSKEQFNILSLDGGGAKGFYSLGVLHEVEAALGQPISEYFDLIYGTSTGSIIATLLSVGKSVDEIYGLYSEHVPKVMTAKGSSAKSAALRQVGEEVFGDLGFDAARTPLGIVATKWESESSIIFKSAASQAHGRTATFLPGFGCALADAVQASCSAYPYFDRHIVTTKTGDEIELFDGGFIANNPTLFAMADAISAMGVERHKCRVLSVGCGHYPEPQPSWIGRLKRDFWLTQLLMKTLEANTNSMDQLRRLVFSDVPTVRIDERYSKAATATDMFESEPKKLNQLFQAGRSSFATEETEFRRVFLTGD